MPLDLVELNKSEPKSKIIARLKRDIAKNKSTLPLREVLEFRREAYGLTAREFAPLLGMQNTHYSEFIHGKRGLTVKAMRRAYAIGVPAELLLKDDHAA